MSDDLEREQLQPILAIQAECMARWRRSASGSAR